MRIETRTSCILSAFQATQLPVLVWEEFKEAPELLRHAGVALHECERRQQDLITHTEETTQQTFLREEGGVLVSSGRINTCK